MKGRRGGPEPDGSDAAEVEPSHANAPRPRRRRQQEGVNDSSLFSSHHQPEQGRSRKEEKKDDSKAASRISLASGTYHPRQDGSASAGASVSEESSVSTQKIKNISTTTKNGTKSGSSRAQDKVLMKEKAMMSEIPSLGMFSAVHQDDSNSSPARTIAPRPPRTAPDVREEEDGDDDENSAEIPEIGAFHEGGGGGRATISRSSRQESTREAQDSNLGMIPLAAEVADDRRQRPPAIQTVEAFRVDYKVWISKPRNQAIAVVMCLLIVGIVVAVVIPITRQDDGQGKTRVESPPPPAGRDDEAEVDTSLVPSSSPTTFAPTTFEERIFTLISAYSGLGVLQDQSTPQFRSLQWVTTDASVADWSDEQILDRYALAVLYFGNDGLRWARVTNFLLPTFHCEWDGVSCNENGEPSTLSLVNEGLSGSLPREIGVLSSLTTLNLDRNLLTGTIPTEIGYLTNLRDLSIPGEDEPRSFIGLSRLLEDAQAPAFNNNLSGSLPSELGLLTDEEVLRLGGNSIVGSIPSELGLMTNLRSLFLENNQLGGEIPFQLGFMTSLEHLSLDRNSLTGGIPNTFCSEELSKIQDLSSDCREPTLICKCCNICCDKSRMCIDIDVTAYPSTSPSVQPSQLPSVVPSSLPSAAPSSNPSRQPSWFPSNVPSPVPTPTVTGVPTSTPTTGVPSRNPSPVPSESPSSIPSSIPSFSPITPEPSMIPTPTLPPTLGCAIHENSCIGNRACNGVMGLCTQSGSCTGRNACRSATDLGVSEGSCVGNSACEQATGIIGQSSCTKDNSCTYFGGTSIGSNSCNCVECCSCYGAGELPSVIPSNSCNIRGECCSTLSPTVPPTKSPTLRPTTAAPTTRQPTPNPTTPRPTRSPTSRPTPLPTEGDAFPAVLDEMRAYAGFFSPTSSLNDLESPQSKSAEWLAQDKVDNGNDWDLIGYELLQRYVLGIFYHSTKGEKWDRDQFFFQETAVCLWGSPGLECTLGDRTSVNDIRLPSNNLVGTLPEEMTYLTALTSLDLHFNNLGGSIYDSLGELTGLNVLSLSNNDLVGTIPASLGQLTALSRLQLYSNSLTGTIPTELTQCTNLKWVYFENNDLSGVIPPGFCSAPFGPWDNRNGALRTDCGGAIPEVPCDCCDFCPG